MSNPLVGRTFQFTWTQGVPVSRTYEMSFLSPVEKRSREVGGTYEGTHRYEYAQVAPDVFVLAWSVPESFSMSITANTESNEIWGYYVERDGASLLQGEISEVGQ